MTRPLRIVVGMSGGVDSSVAAWLLKRAGHEVVGVFMKNWEDDDTDEYCTSRVDLVDAASVADVIGIDLEAVNFAGAYRERVFAQFLREYSAGRTPNPDVLCNSEIKFKAFLDLAQSLGADAMATGHYARVDHIDGGAQLRKAADPAKDQSYFLHQLTQRQLGATMFPLGELTKREVRVIAREQGLPTHAKKDSTGICFIGERPFRDFLARYLPKHPGAIETPEGRVVGTHHGLAYYTLGQRQGLGVGGVRDGEPAPWFVADKDSARNVLIVVQGRDDPRLYARAVETVAMHWIAGAASDRGKLSAMTRYRMSPAPCDVVAMGDGRYRVDFDLPQWAPTPGQYVALYDGDVCLGGAVIERALRTPAAQPSPAVAA
ncbi:MAG: tRNA 2-thiouridine(34) synthase MnmA [Betaproteobacteria bacterium]